MNYQNALRGIKKLYTAEVLSIVGSIALIAAFLYLALNGLYVSDGGAVARAQSVNTAVLILAVVFFIAFFVLLIISAIMTLVGLITASRDDVCFKRALFVYIALIVLNVLTNALQLQNTWVDEWLKVLTTLAELVTTLLVLSGIIKAANALGNADVAALSEKTQKWVLCTFGLSTIVALVLALFFRNNAVLALVLLLAIIVLEIVSYVLYLRVLARAKDMR